LSAPEATDEPGVGQCSRTRHITGTVTSSARPVTVRGAGPTCPRIAVAPARRYARLSG
jgi:hypothetical protein